MKKNVRKLFAVLLAAGTAVSLVSCAAKTAETTAAVTAAALPESTAAAETTAQAVIPVESIIPVQESKAEDPASSAAAQETAAGSAAEAGASLKAQDSSAAGENASANVRVVDAASPGEFAKACGLGSEAEGTECFEKAYIPDNMEKTILGSDDRVTIEDPTVYPFCGIARLVVHGKCGCDWAGSGFMVGPRLMLTAAHCIVCTEHSVFPEKIDLYFGYRGNNDYYIKYDRGMYMWAATSFPGGYTHENEEWDFGYILLDDRIGDYTGGFGTLTTYDEYFNGMWIEAAGYRDGVLKTCTGTAEVSNDKLFRYNADTLPGNSGGPVFNEECRAVGIIIAQNDTTNIGRRLTSDLMEPLLGELGGELIGY